MRRLPITLTLLASLLASACATDGLRRAEKSYSGLAPEELRIGDKASAIAQAAWPIIHDPVVTAYLAEIKGKLLSKTRFGQVPGRIYVSRNRAVYAYSFPNGDIFVSSGMLALAESEAEVAAVLGHELGHGLLGHFPKAREQQAKLDSMAGRTDTAGGPAGKDLNSSFATVMRFGNSRERELEADQFMLQIMERSEYDPCGAPVIFAKMLSIQRQVDPAANQTQLFDTHPATPERLEQINDHVSTDDCSRHPPAPSARYRTNVLARLGLD